MICPAAKVGADDESRFLDPNSSQTFVFDHLRLSATDVEPFVAPADPIEMIRSQLDEEAEKYVKEHFQGGVWSVFAIRDATANALAQESSRANDKPDQSDLAPAPADEDVNEKDGSGDETPELKPQTEETSQELENKADESKKQPGNDLATYQLYIVGNKYNPANYWYIPCFQNSLSLKPITIFFLR